MSDRPATPPPAHFNEDGSRQHQIFPDLSKAQFALVHRYGQTRSFQAGEVLYSQGERHVPMYVIVSGTIELSRSSALGSHAIATLGAGAFTGEVGTLAGRAAIATVRARTDVEAIVIDEDALRTLVISEAELSETIMRAFILRRVAFIEDESGSIILVGSRASADTLRLREFLARNAHPVAYFDIDEHAEAAQIMQRFGIAAGDVPAVVTPDGAVLKQPSMRDLADATGISSDQLGSKRFDVVVVGAGPGGLAAAVYAASEGLSVAVIDSKAPGGQAGSSSKIENYFGFPTGISGQALAGRGLSQARKFGAEVAVPVEALSLDCTDTSGDFHISIDNDEKVCARTIVVATGARYRKPDLPDLEKFEGRGVYYNASFMEANFCADEEIIVVGGGNSAGQAAVFLSGFAKHVHIMVRAEGLAASMSHYLIQRIDAAANISLHSRTQIVELRGDQKLDSLLYKSGDDAPRELPVRHVFLFLGAEPNTAWLGDCVALDQASFVLTGAQIANCQVDRKWPLERAPHLLETSRPGIFAVGDVRSGSVKRVAAAVGEGAAAIQFLHQVLAT